MRKFILAAVMAAVLIVLSLTSVASASSSCWYSPRGCVSVRGYYKPSTHTYVSPYFRNYPGYGSYRLPSYSYVPKVYGYGF
jgi:hypothetical protein